jgi:hypothetical protein
VAGLTITPGGRFGTVTVIWSVYSGGVVAVTEISAIEPTVTVWLAGDNVIVIASGGGGALTVSFSVVVRVNPPDVPVMVTFVVPSGASAVATKTIGSIWPGVRLAPLGGIIVTSVGSPLTANVTVPLNPPVAVTPTCSGSLCEPCGNVRVFGVTVMAKSGPGATTLS